MSWSSPACSARIGHSIWAARWTTLAPPAFAGRRPVEADRAGETVPGSGGDPRRAAAEAEADREDRRDAARAKLLDRRAGVRLDAVVGRLLDVRHVLPVGVPLRHAGGAAEVVERDRARAHARRNGGRAPRRSGRGPRTSGKMTTPVVDRASGDARKAANSLPSAAVRTRSSCETAAPAIRGIGGSESRSKHMLRS